MPVAKCEKAPRGAFSLLLLLLRQTFSKSEAVTNTRRNHNLVAVNRVGVRTIHLRFSTLLTQLNDAFRIDVRTLGQRVVRLQTELMELHVVVVVRARGVTLHIGVRVRGAKCQCRRQCVTCIHFLVVEARCGIAHRELEAALRPCTANRYRTDRVVCADTVRTLRLNRILHQIRHGIRCTSLVVHRTASVGGRILQLQVSRCNLERAVRILCASAVSTVVTESTSLIRPNFYWSISLNPHQHWVSAIFER